jgi:hypothetical protein
MERQISNKLNEVLGWTSHRTQQFCGKMGDADINVPECPNLLIESKAVERLNVHKVMDRAEEDARPKGKIPVVAHTKNRTGWLITVKLEDLPQFVEMVHASMVMRGSRSSAAGERESGSKQDTT